MHAVEVVEVELRDRRQDHDPGGVHDDVDPAERLLDGVERRLHLCGLRDVAADGDRPAAGPLDGGHDLLRPGLVARVVHADGHAVARQPLGDRAADPARAPGDEGDASAAHGYQR